MTCVEDILENAGAETSSWNKFQFNGFTYSAAWHASMFCSRHRTQAITAHSSRTYHGEVDDLIAMFKIPLRIREIPIHIMAEAPGRCGHPSPAVHAIEDHAALCHARLLAED